MKAQPKKQPLTRKPRPKRASMGELHYFLLTFHQLIDYAPEVVRQQIFDATEAHCPTLVAAMQAWGTDKVHYAPEWDTLTFTYHIPLPEAFQKDTDAYEGAAQCAKHLN